MTHWISICIGIVGALISAATFIRMMLKESSVASRQLAILTAIDALRKEFRDEYVSQDVFRIETNAIKSRLGWQKI
jgi:hypothetical protein